jgi:hypothetical protein
MFENLILQRKNIFFLVVNYTSPVQDYAWKNWQNQVLKNPYLISKGLWAVVSNMYGAQSIQGLPC